MGYGAASKLSPERQGNIKGIQKWVIDAHQTYTFVSAFCQETRLSWQNRIPHPSASRLVAVAYEIWIFLAISRRWVAGVL